MSPSPPSLPLFSSAPSPFLSSFPSPSFLLFHSSPFLTIVPSCQGFVRAKMFSRGGPPVAFAEFKVKTYHKCYNLSETGSIVTILYVYYRETFVLEALSYILLHRLLSLTEPSHVVQG